MTREFTEEEWREFSNTTYPELKAEIERLKALKTPASTQLLNITKACLDDAEADNARLMAAIQRIDGINDNPADFNVEINAVCDTILRPALKDTKP